MIRSIVGTLVAGQPRTVETTIEQASRIANDKIAITSIQRTDSGITVTWWRQPGEVWEMVLLKVGDKFWTFSARRKDGKKISAEAGFEVRPPPPPPVKCTTRCRPPGGAWRRKHLCLSDAATERRCRAYASTASPQMADCGAVASRVANPRDDASSLRRSTATRDWGWFAAIGLS
jgi:hypothetical protein